MDIEKLTKSQTILLALLVSFVTSIATGIVTISLVEQTPPAIMQSVSRIVKETVQSSTPTKGQTASTIVSQTGGSTSKEPTLSQKIAAANRSIVRLYGGEPENPIFLGLGILLDKEGTVLADFSSLGQLEKATVVLSNGSSTPVSVVTRDSLHDLAYLAPVSTSSSLVFTPAALASESPVVGDTVVAFAGQMDLRIASGLVVAKEDGIYGMISTNVPADSIIKGSPLMDTNGEFVGISTGSSRNKGMATFVSISSNDKQETVQ